MSPEVMLTAFIVCITPGIGVVYTLSSTLGGGFRAGVRAAVAQKALPGHASVKIGRRPVVVAFVAARAARLAQAQA